jgi:hypothetical protein
MGKFAISKRNNRARPELPNIENETKQKREENNFSKADEICGPELLKIEKETRKRKRVFKNL